MIGDLLGYEVKDVVTGMSGIVTAETVWLNGCVRCEIETCDKEGKPVEYWFDKGRLERTSADRRVMLMQIESYMIATTDPGGGRPDPSRPDGRAADMRMDSSPRVA